MHANSRLHQSIGPGSVIINKTDERELRVMQARLRDLAFAVDVSNEAMVGGATLAEIWDQGTIAKSDPKCVMLISLSFALDFSECDILCFVSDACLCIFQAVLSHVHLGQAYAPQC